jgi:uncharacterized protein (TIGR03435 family)
LAIFGQIENGPAFDAVSVKLVEPPAPGAVFSFGLRRTPGRITGTQQLQNLINDAYSLKPYELVLPDNKDIYLNCYRIDAVMSAATTPEEMKLMFRRMLRERFDLQFHREKRMSLSIS